MGRSRRGRRRRRHGSRTGLARTSPIRHLGREAAVPDSDGTLADGVLVEADLSARLLGVRLLTLRADVVLLPAQLREGPALEGEVVPSPTVVSSPGGPNGSRRTPRSDDNAVIAEAVRLVAESGRMLDRLDGRDRARGGRS